MYGERVHSRTVDLCIGQRDGVGETCYGILADIAIGERVLADNGQTYHGIVLFVECRDHLARQLDVRLARKQNLLRVVADTPQLEQRHHSREEQQQYDADESDKHAFAYSADR